MSFKGKFAVVTGGTRGIGRAISEALAKEGARVAVLYQSSEDRAREMRDMGFLTIKCDVGNREEVRRAAKVVESEFGVVDILVNNAGVMYSMPFEEFDEEKYQRMMRINVNGVIYTVLEFLPLLRRSREPSIINISSIAGIGTALEGTTFYAISKAAVIILTKRLAFELGKYGIRVNAVAPGWVETDMTTGSRSPEEVEKIKQRIRERTILRTTGRPEDIANVVLFLASSASRYMTGQVLVVDGGRIDHLTHSI